MVYAVRGATVLLSVALSATAVLTVYFAVGTRVERELVQRQTQLVVRSLLGGLPLPQAWTDTLRASIPTPDPGADEAVAAQNSALRSRAFLAVGLLVAVALLVSRRMAGPLFGAALKTAVKSGLLAAGTEIAFLLLIARNYDSVDPNSVRLQILQQLAQDAQS